MAGSRVVTAGLILCVLVASVAKGQRYAPPRLEDGKPDLQGIWQARTTASADVEAHGGGLGLPAGKSVITDPPDGKIPYQPWALAKKQENFAKRTALDPLEKCFLPGVPRVTYLPFPFQIFQTSQFAAITYEFAHATRTIHFRGQHLEELEFWMGDSRGRWEGDTLVVDVANLGGETWLDASGNFHSEALHVVERYTRTSPDTLQYEATLEDPKVFTRPWKISLPLYLNRDPDAQLYEYECHVYLEDAAKERK